MSCVGPGGGRSAGLPSLACSRASAPTRVRTGAVSLAGQVAPARVEPLVAGALGGPVARERLEEVLARPGPQVEDGRPDVVRAGLARGPDGLGELLRPVGEAGQDRRDRDVRADACVDEATDDLEPLAGRCRARLGRAPDAVVERRHRDVDGHLGPPGGLLEHVDVAPDERAARDDRGTGCAPARARRCTPG